VTTTAAVLLIGAVLCGSAVAVSSLGGLYGALLVDVGLVFLALGIGNMVLKASHSKPLMLTQHGVRRQWGGKDDWGEWDDIVAVRAFWSRAGWGAELVDVDRALTYSVLHDYWSQPDVRFC